MIESGHHCSRGVLGTCSTLCPHKDVSEGNPPPGDVARDLSSQLDILSEHGVAKKGGATPTML